MPRTCCKRPRRFRAGQGIAENSWLKAAVWSGHFAELGPELTIGISWRGGVTPWNRRRRTTRLEEWLPLFRVPGTRFISFQNGDTTGERDALESKHGIMVADFMGSDESFDDFTARADALDLVISMAGTVVHVAGALDKPVWTLTPRVPSWHYGLSGATSSWYPSMTLLRQEHGQSWAVVLEEAAVMLAEFTAKTD